MKSQNSVPFCIADTAQVCIYENKEALWQAGISAVRPVQRHTNKVVEIVTGEEDLENCDGVFTKNKNIVLGIGTSDCAPICFISPNQIGIIHCGWRGFVSGIIENMSMCFDISQTTLYVGPFLHEFEIQKDFCYEKIEEKFLTQFFREKDEKIIFEFKKALEHVLRDTKVVFDSRDTRNDLSLPSHRRGIDHNFITTISLN